MSIPAAYGGVILIWATTPLAIKWSGDGPGPLFGVASRMVLGVALCLLLMRIMRVSFPRHRQAWLTYVAAGMGVYVAMTSVYLGAQYITSGMVSVVFGLTPLVTAFMAALWLQERVLTVSKITGTLFGIAGLTVIFQSSLQLDGNAIYGVTGVLVAVMAHSASAVWIKRIGAHLPAVAVTSGGLLVATPAFVLTWLVFDGRWPQLLTEQAIMSIVYLGVFGSVLGFAMYFYVLKHVSPSQIALITLVTPVLALVIGNQLNHEPILPSVGLGSALILGGLALHQWGGLCWARLARLRKL
jgi:drug/metabolite transporter (DMT)-like permease